MKIQVVTLFPELVGSVAGYGVVGRAIAAGRAGLGLTDPRDFATDRHRTVDDRPYGGGPGMVMKVEPLRSAMRSARAAVPVGSPTLLLSPQGVPLTQRRAAELAALPGLVLVAGRYEGVDERLIEAETDGELSIGDYVLSGGELAAMVVIDCVVRLLPGVLGAPESAAQDSFARGLLDCPHYTRPEEVDGRRVPAVLLGGDHEAIRRWRLTQALARTWERRPELLADRGQSDEERELLARHLAASTSGDGDEKDH